MSADIIEIDVDGLAVPVVKSEYDADPEGLVAQIRANREAVRFHAGANHQAADAILGAGSYPKASL